MKAVAPAQSLYRRDGLPLGSGHGIEAGTDRLAVQVDEAGAALPFAAAVLGAGELELLAQDLQQPSLRIGGDARLRPIDAEPDRHRHGSPPLARILAD